MPNICFKYLDIESKQEKEFFASFTTEDVLALNLYKDKTTRLKQSRLVQNETSVQLSIQFDKNKGILTSSEIPNDNDVAALLHLIRPFTLKKEASNFERISGILFKRLENDEIRKELAYSRDLFSGRDFQKQMRMSSKGHVINSEEMLKIWLNAFEYHSDSEKVKEFESLDKLLPMTDFKAVFISMIFDQVDAIFRVNGIVGHILFQIENDK